MRALKRGLSMARPLEHGVKTHIVAPARLRSSSWCVVHVFLLLLLLPRLLILFALGLLRAPLPVVRGGSLHAGARVRDAPRLLQHLPEKARR